MMSTRFRPWLLEFVLLASACADPSSEASEGSGSAEGTSADTEPSTVSDGETGGETENCGMHMLQSYDEDCQGIGTVQDLLDTAAGERTSELAWSTFASEEITHMPNVGSTPTTLRLYADGGDAVCHHFCDPCPGLPCGAASEPARIEVAALVDIESEDGALAETVDVFASTYGLGGSVDYNGSIAPADLQGTLEVQLVATDFRDLAISISGVIAGEVSSGALSANAMHVDPGGPAVTTPIATWPSP